MTLLPLGLGTADRPARPGFEHIGVTVADDEAARQRLLAAGATELNPVGLGDGVNRYSYTSGNPVGRRDPTGQYGEAGHYYTVYVVALAAGFDPKTARTMAILAQVPDEILELDGSTPPKVVWSYSTTGRNPCGPSPQPTSAGR